MTMEEAKLIIEGLKEMQEDNNDNFILSCPRCGYERMNKEMSKNALSMREDVYICNSCRMEEALLYASGKKPLDLNDWAIMIKS